MTRDDFDAAFAVDYEGLVRFAEAAGGTADAVHDLYVRWVEAAAYEDFKRDGPALLGTFFRAAVMNQVRSEIRAEVARRRLLTYGPDEHETPDGRIEYPAGWGRLDPADRALLTLVYLDGLGTRQTSRALKRPYETVRRQVHEALEVLRQSVS